MAIPIHQIQHTLRGFTPFLIIVTICGLTTLSPAGLTLGEPLPVELLPFV